MNYPIWELPGSGLLIAVVAIVHVFISHFAVGGGLFLVLTERLARRTDDAAMLAWLKGHTKFFTLLTLVLGAITGVGIWFTIGLVHPAATSSLINTFVWGWAIEWTFFVVEIAAAMVYFYGWDRLAPQTHMRVGWIYFWSAWLSLVVINGILTFMLTPGGWLASRSFWDGILNPTFVPSVVARTAAAAALAGVYALLTLTRTADGELKARVARYAVTRWIVPMVIILPLSIAWVLYAASGAGVPVRAILGGTREGFGVLLDVLGSPRTTGHPVAQQALRVLVFASVAVAAFSGAVLVRRHRFGRPLALATMAAAFVALGAAEWVREGLRKPYVIGNYMLTNGIRVGAEDAYSVEPLNRGGVLAAAAWTRLPADLASQPQPMQDLARGRELFRLECSSCHTTDGYLAIRPLVQGAAPETLNGMLGRLETWRGRRMPPFIGTADERRAVALYLASLGGAAPEALAGFGAQADTGARVFAENCAMCHAPDGDFPLDAKGRSAAVFYELIGRLPTVNEAMPPFEGTDAERQALSEHLTTLAPARKGGAR